MALNPNAFVDGVINGSSLHIEPPSYTNIRQFTTMCQWVLNLAAYWLALLFISIVNNISFI